MVTVRRACVATLAAAVALSLRTPAAAPASSASNGAGATAAPPRAATALAGMLLEIRQGRLVVAEVLPGSAAAAAGLLAGDALLVINDASLIDLEPISAEGALDLLRATRSDEARLILGRGAGTLGVALPIRGAAALAGGSRSPLVACAEAPEFSARTLKGETVSLRELRGKPVLLDFWAAWCPPCRDAVIPLRRVAGEYGERLAIVGISLDDDPKAFEAFAYNNHLPGHQIRDGGWRGPISALYGIPATGIPYAVLIDARGTVLVMGTTLEEHEQALARLFTTAPSPDRDRRPAR